MSVISAPIKTNLYWSILCKDKCENSFNDFETDKFRKTTNKDWFLPIRKMFTLLNHLYFCYLSIIRRISLIICTGQWAWLYIKFSFSEKATKFVAFFHLIWHLISNCRIKWRIIPNFSWLIFTYSIIHRIQIFLLTILFDRNKYILYICNQLIAKHTWKRNPWKMASSC